MKLVFSSPSGPEVGFLKSLLDGAGIACEVRNESTYPLLPGAPFQPEIWVLNDEDFTRACEVRDAWQESPVTPVSEEARDPHMSARSQTKFVALAGFVLVGAAVIISWRLARLADWGRLAGVITLFGLPGLLLIWNAAPLLIRRRRR